MLLALAAVAAEARDIVVDTYRYAGPYLIKQPAILDSLNAEQKAFDATTLLDTPLSLNALAMAAQRTGQTLPRTDDDAAAALHLLGFDIDAASFTTATIAVKGIEHFTLYVDGQQSAAATPVQLTPARHSVALKMLTTPTSEVDSLSISVSVTDSTATAISTTTSLRKYTLDDVLYARHFGAVELSSDGKWAIVPTWQTHRDGTTESRTQVRELSTWRLLDERDGIRWLPTTPRYYYIRTDVCGKRQLVTRDPATQTEIILVRDLPEGSFQVSPTEDALIYTFTSEAPAERPDVYEVVHPDDRQPGWRRRTRVSRFDIATGIMQPLTHSHSNIFVSDISLDGRYLLLSKQEFLFGSRPTQVSSLLKMDIQTLHVDTLVRRDGFIGTACFSPDGTQVLISGSPEALGGIGKNVDDGQTPSMIDNQLYIMNARTREVRPLTRDFAPCVQRFEWNPRDGMVYFTAEDRDSINLFRLEPQTGIIRQIQLPEEIVMSFSKASAATSMLLVGQSASNSDRLYALDFGKAKSKGTKDNGQILNCQIVKLDDLSSVTLKDIRLGSCEAWTWRNPQGDDISCRYYLPPAFDATKRYPMIVNYYGGCSPISRYFESRYPHHAYAAQGYVVLVVIPSGSTGFGQRFSARHVATAGRGPAEDIIGAVKAFCAEHNYVDTEHIGCIGASYGGFMTQYLLTQTDIFAAGISHAGISDHTSYWGEGYWGYTYSQVSMADRMPWSDRELYVDQSPLYLADRIHTPLLFIHGDADHNVPVGESIQMYTALKVLERETALVLVRDEDHHILDREKRIRWQQTIDAWFARWLRNDRTWWDALYPPKALE